MIKTIDLSRIYGPSEDVVVREIEGEIVIVPLTSGIGDLEDEFFSLDETGRAVWSKLDGRRPLDAVVRELLEEYEDEAPGNVIQEDVIGLLQELLDRRIIVEKGRPE